MQISNELMNIICEAASDNEVSVRTDYSGRGMYGARCLGLDGDFHYIMRTLQDVTETTHFAETTDCNSDLWDEWITFAFNFSMDSMGLEQIIYWSSIEAPEDWEGKKEC